MRKKLCLACARELTTYNRPIHCTRGGVSWTVTLNFVGCVSCGKYFISADEMGVHTTLQTAGLK